MTAGRKFWSRCRGVDLLTAGLVGAVAALDLCPEIQHLLLDDLADLFELERRSLSWSHAWVDAEANALDRLQHLDCRLVLMLIPVVKRQVGRAHGVHGVDRE